MVNTIRTKIDFSIYFTFYFTSLLFVNFEELIQWGFISCCWFFYFINHIYIFLRFLIAFSCHCFLPIHHLLNQINHGQHLS